MHGAPRWSTHVSVGCARPPPRARSAPPASSSAHSAIWNMSAPRTRVPRRGIPGEKPEIVPDYHVVNGIDIANSPDTFPLGVVDMPSLGQNRIDALRAEKTALRDALDGLKDALTAESAYQLALGN